jgi:ribose transport system permease protein
VSEQSPAPAPATTVIEPSQKPTGLGQRLLGGAAGRNLGLIIALLVLVVVGWITAGQTFMNVDNLLTIIRFASIIGVISIGMTFVITAGGIDLSVGSVMGPRERGRLVVVDPDRSHAVDLAPHGRRRHRRWAGLPGSSTAS